MSTPSACMLCTHWTRMRADSNWGICGKISTGESKLAEITLIADLTGTLYSRDIFYCAEFTRAPQKEKKAGIVERLWGTTSPATHVKTTGS